jgi:hypothetical protein
MSSLRNAIKKWFFELVTGRCYYHRNVKFEWRMHKQAVPGDCGRIICPICVPITEDYYIVGYSEF